MKIAKKIIISIILLSLMTSCTAHTDIRDNESNKPEPSSTSLTSDATTGNDFMPPNIDRVQTMLTHIQEADIKYILSLPASASALSVLDLPIEVYEVRGFTSAQQHVVISAAIGKYETARVLRLQDHIDIPNATMLTIDEGFRNLIFCSTTNKLSAIEVLELPSTMDTISDGNSNRDFHETFSPELKMLKEIHVAQGNEYFISENGILYQINPNYNLGITFKKRLTAIPQNYENDNQTVNISDGTDRIVFNAIYRCRNIQKVILPDSVVTIDDGAIIATAEHPLTVVCSRDSAAAAYVEEFGEQYHLTVEYID